MVSEDYNLLIVGYGVIGKAISKFYQDRHNIFIQEKDYCGYINKSGDIIKDKDVFNVIKFDIGFICVNYQTEKDLGEFIDLLNDVANKCKYVIIKTTIDFKIVDYLSNSGLNNVYFMPEFLREISAEIDYRNEKEFFVSTKDREFKEFFSVIHPNIKLISVSLKEACLIKLFRNVFLASKVALFNQFKLISKGMGCEDSSWDVIREMVCRDERIGNSHTFVPGLNGEWGFGGKCFPKDLDLLIELSKLNQSANNVDLLLAVKEFNQEIKGNN